MLLTLCGEELRKEWSGNGGAGPGWWRRSEVRAGLGGAGGSPEEHPGLAGPETARRPQHNSKDEQVSRWWGPSGRRLPG